VPALQGCAIDGMADCAAALDDRPPHFRLAFSRRTSTIRWTAAVPPSRCVRSRSDTDLYRADVVKLEIISCASMRVARPPELETATGTMCRDVLSNRAMRARQRRERSTKSRRGARFCENPQEHQSPSDRAGSRSCRSSAAAARRSTRMRDRPRASVLMSQDLAKEAAERGIRALF
jgi:hypothetical protein